MNTVVSPLKHRFPSARKIWLNIHLYLGLTAGFALALTGLTGSLLVFKGPILKMEVGDIFDVDGPPPSNANVDEWIANARRAYSDIKAVNLVVGPGFYLTGGNAAVLLGVDFAGNKPSHVTVNPNTGLPLGKFVYDDTYLSLITAFHAHFAVSRPWQRWGLTALACLGVAMIVSMAIAFAAGTKKDGRLIGDQQCAVERRGLPGNQLRTQVGEVADVFVLPNQERVEMSLLALPLRALNPFLAQRLQVNSPFIRDLKLSAREAIHAYLPGVEFHWRLSISAQSL